MINNVANKHVLIPTTQLLDLHFSHIQKLTMLIVSQKLVTWNPNIVHRAQKSRRSVLARICIVLKAARSKHCTGRLPGSLLS